MKVLFSILLPLIFCSAQAQKEDKELLTEAEKLKTLFKEDPIAASVIKSSLEFILDKNSKELHVRETEYNQYLSLKPNTSFVKRNFYSDHSSLESYSLKSPRGKSMPFDKLCGHYQQQDIFYSDAQLCAFKFNFRLVGESAIFESTTIYNDPKYVTHAYMHDDVPVQHREISIIIPDWVNAELREMNFEGYSITKRTTKEDNQTVYTFSIENLESGSHDENVPGHLHYLPHILIITKSYQQQGKTIKVLSSTDDLYQWYSKLVTGGKENYNLIKPKVEELTSGLTTAEDKIKAIYYWVQDNIKYIAFEDGVAAFKPEEANEVFYNRYGDCKGMANLTKVMLQIAGYDARLTWIGTDRIPYNHDVPSLAVDNHMICSVLLNGKIYILDATEKYNPFGTYAERIQGKEILIEDGAYYILQHVPVEPLDKYLQESFVNYTIDGSQLKGEGKEVIKGEYKKMLLNLVFSMKDEDREKLLKIIVSGASDPDNFSINDFPDYDREKNIKISYDVDLKNHLSYYDKELYIDLDFEGEYKEASLKKDRKVPYKFDSKIYKKSRAELSIPAGFQLSYLPKSFRVQNDYFFFDLAYTIEKNKIIYSKEIRIQKNILPVAEFSNWNTAIKGVREFYDDQIILKSND